MTDEALPAFSPECVSLLLQDAERAGLKGATAITVALRNQLTLMKGSGRVPDQRTQTYYVVGRSVDMGVSTPIEGVCDISGLAMLNSIAADLIAEASGMDRLAAPDDLVEGQLKAARVNLTRKGFAHLQNIWNFGEHGHALSWLDLYVFMDTELAANYAANLPTGKVF